MRQHELRPPRGAKKARKRVGRGNGSKRGTYSGRGRGGQRSRSNPGIDRTFEGGQRPLVQRMPAKRGFHNPFRLEYSVVNVSRLAEAFEPDALITPRLLQQRRVVRNLNQPIKILGEGELDRPLRVYAHKFSASAQQKIEAAGGSCTVLDLELIDIPEQAPVEEEAT